MLFCFELESACREFMRIAEILESSADLAGRKYSARCLITPAADDAPTGDYVVLKITADKGTIGIAKSVMQKHNAKLEKQTRNELLIRLS